MSKQPKPRNRAAQDATLINLRALKKRQAEIERQIRTMGGVVIRLCRRVKALEAR